MCAICGSIFDRPRLERELATIESRISDPAVWADSARSQPLMRERRRLEGLLESDRELERRSSDVNAYFDLAREGEAVGKISRGRAHKAFQSAAASKALAAA